MERDEVVRRAWQELEPELAEQGYELVEVEYGQSGARPVLRLYIDKEGGITLDDCAEVSQYLSPVLDMRDFIADSYMLEVSSPGIDRPLRKPMDFRRYLGEPVRLQTWAPVQGRRNFKGTLAGFEDGLIQLESDQQEFTIHIENLKRAKLDR